MLYYEISAGVADTTAFAAAVRFNITVVAAAASVGSDGTRKSWCVMSVRIQSRGMMFCGVGGAVVELTDDFVSVLTSLRSELAQQARLLLVFSTLLSRAMLSQLRDPMIICKNVVTAPYIAAAVPLVAGARTARDSIGADVRITCCCVEFLNRGDIVRHDDLLAAMHVSVEWRVSGEWTAVVCVRLGQVAEIARLSSRCAQLYATEVQRHLASTHARASLVELGYSHGDTRCRAVVDADDRPPLMALRGHLASLARRLLTALSHDAEWLPRASQAGVRWQHGVCELTRSRMVFQ